MSKRNEAAEIVARLDADYRRATDALRTALIAFMRGGGPPDPALRAERVFAYPELRIDYRPTVAPPRLARSTASPSPGPTSSPTT
jgi:AMP nucleosidase